MKLNLKFFLCPVTNHMDSSYSCPVSILKSTSDIITDIIAQKFNKSVDSGNYPSKLKMAKAMNSDFQISVIVLQQNF